ncbi:hypothetical protein SVIOM74S_04650 [Streptomyces violarus]
MIAPYGADRTAQAAALSAALSVAAHGEPVALARVVHGPAGLLGRAVLVRPDGAHEGGLGGHPDLDRTVIAQARALLDAGRTGTVEVSEDGSQCPGGLTLLVESAVPPPRMIVFGAIDFAAALVRAGKFLGYHVTVCDARPVFATRVRFPDADEIVVDWPHRYQPREHGHRRAHGAVRAHPRRQVRHPPADRSPAAAGRLCRRHGLTPHPRGPQPAASRGGRERSRAPPGSGHPSASTWALVRPRRPPCRSRRRSSPHGTAARAGRSPDRRPRSTGTSGWPGSCRNRSERGLPRRRAGGAVAGDGLGPSAAPRERVRQRPAPWRGRAGGR